MAGLVWVSFIAWGCHFHSGGGIKGTTTDGRLHELGRDGRHWARCCWPPARSASLDAPVAFGIAVGLGAAIICLSSKVPLLATIPASVYGFASIAGALALDDGNPQEGDPADGRLDHHRRGLRLRLRDDRQRADQEGVPAALDA